MLAAKRGHRTHDRPWPRVQPSRGTSTWESCSVKPERSGGGTRAANSSITREVSEDQCLPDGGRGGALPSTCCVAHTATEEVPRARQELCRDGSENDQEGPREPSVLLDRATCARRRRRERWGVRGRPQTPHRRLGEAVEGQAAPGSAGGVWAVRVGLRPADPELLAGQRRCLRGGEGSWEEGGRGNKLAGRCVKEDTFLKRSYFFFFL